MNKYYITARRQSSNTLLFLAEDDVTKRCHWTKNIDNAKVFINRVEAMAYKNPTMYDIIGLDIAADSIMVQTVEYNMIPVDSYQFQDFSYMKIIGTSESYTGRTIELWCLSNMNNPNDTIRDQAIKLFDKYYGLNPNDPKQMRPAGNTYFFVVEREGDIFLYRDRVNSPRIGDRDSFVKGNGQGKRSHNHYFKIG